MDLTTTVLVNLGYALMLMAFLARDMLWLRTLLVVGQSTVVIYAAHMNALPVAYWNALFALINGWHMLRIIRERRAIELPQELREFYERTFAALSRREFLDLWHDGSVEQRRDALLLREGESPGRLMFLIDGDVAVEKQGRRVAQLGRGRFLAEMGFLTGEAASADARAVGAVRYIAWNNAALLNWRTTKPALWTKLLSVLGKDLVDKIKAASTVPT
ncbi:MAG: Crp/Fnr family transcriptional regulator [Nevskiales bacterium]